MKQQAFTTIIAGSLMFAVLHQGTIPADSPLPPPFKKTTWSTNKRFYAIADPVRHVTTIYQADQNGKGKKLWSMYGWFRVSALSDDGEYVVTGYDGMNLIPLEYDKQQVMLYFFRRGELINYVTLDQIVRDASELKRTASHYYWGDYQGIDETGRFLIETVGGRKFRFDVTTGTPVSE